MRSVLVFNSCIDSFSGRLNRAGSCERRVRERGKGGSKILPFERPTADAPFSSSDAGSCSSYFRSCPFPSPTRRSSPRASRPSRLLAKLKLNAFTESQTWFPIPVDSSSQHTLERPSPVKVDDDLERAPQTVGTSRVLLPLLIRGAPGTVSLPSSMT